MQFNEDKIKAAARMVRIGMTDRQAGETLTEMEGIMKWIGMLDEVDTDGVAPLTSTLEFQVPLREDVMVPNGGVEDILAGAPDRIGATFGVPKVVE